MCTNQRVVNNPYTGRPVLTNCRVCPACLQQRANALTNRLRIHSENMQKTGYICYFVTLDYSNDYVPYLYKGDLANDTVPLYRDSVSIDKFTFDKKTDKHFDNQE